MKRPVGFTLLALLLSWYAFAGLMLVVSALAGAPGTNVSWSILGAAGAVLALSSVTAAYALWRVQSWAHKAFIGWLASLLLFGALLALSIHVPSDAHVRQAVLSALVLGVVFGTICSRYVRRNVTSS